MHEAPGKPPLLFLMGGNGVGIGLLERQPRMIGALARDRDVLLVDHRGAGLSTPRVLCRQFNDATEASFGSVEKLHRCAHELRAAGIDPNWFGPAEAAFDLRDLRKALDLGMWDVYAVSYGTRVAKSLLDVDSGGIRRLILDGVVGWDSNAWTAGALLNPLITLFDECARDAACGRAYPDLEANLAQVLEALESRPVSGRDGHISADQFMSVVQTALESVTARGHIPMAIELAARGDLSAWAALKEGAADESPPPADPSFTFYGQVCREEYLLRDRPELFAPPVRLIAPVIAAHTKVDFPGNIGRFCTILGYRAADPKSLAATAKEVPVLIFNGELDMATPLDQAARAATYLRRSQSMEFPATGHWVLRRRSPCAMPLLVAFLDNPESTLDTNCVAALPGVPWALPQGP